MTDNEHLAVKATLEKIEELLNQAKGKQLDENGHEVLDPRPMAPPVGYKKQPSMVEHIRSMVRGELLRHAAESQGFETFEDSEDFETGDDMDDPRTPYEAVFDPPATPLPGEQAEGARDPSPPRGDGEKAPPSPAPNPAAGSNPQPSTPAP